MNFLQLHIDNEASFSLMVVMVDFYNDNGFGFCFGSDC